MSYTVVGGGIAGLATAHYLRKLPSTSNVIVLEAADRVGGWIQTTHHPDGVRVEHGVRTVRPKGVPGANTLEIVEEIGLAHEVTPIPSTHPTALNRFIYAKGALHKLPSSFGAIFKPNSLFPVPIAAMGLKDLFAKAKQCEDDSLFGFVERRFGAPMAEYMIDPMTRGICAGDAREISAAAFVAGPLFEMEQESGGILRHTVKSGVKGLFKPKEQEVYKSDLVRRAREEQWSVWSLSSGLQTLPEKFAEHLANQGIEIRTRSKIQEIKNGKGATVVTNNEEISCDHVFLGSPAHASAKLVKDVNQDVGNILESIPYVDVVVVNVEFAEPITDIDAFGFLVPSAEKEVPILGAIFDTCAFKQKNSVYTVMMGGAWFKSLFGQNPDENELGDLAVKELCRVLGSDAEPIRVTVKVHRNAIAQYTVGHKQRVARARKALVENGLNLSILGSAYDGVGINDAITSGKNQVHELAKKSSL